MFLKISAISQENICVGVFFIKKETPAQVKFAKFETPVKFAKLSRTLFLTKHLQWLLLDPLGSHNWGRVVSLDHLQRPIVLLKLDTLKVA